MDGPGPRILSASVSASQIPREPSQLAHTYSLMGAFAGSTTGIMLVSLIRRIN
jgi:hypothetical protein